MKSPNLSPLWTSEELSELLKQYSSGLPLSQLKIAGRSNGAARLRVHQLKRAKTPEFVAADEARRSAQAEKLLSGDTKRSPEFKEWTWDELHSLRAQINQGFSIGEISIPGRTEGAIWQKLRALGLECRKRKNWREREKRELLRQATDGITLEKMHLPGRTPQAIAHMLNRLGIPFVREADIERDKKRREKRANRPKKLPDPRIWTAEQIALLQCAAKQGKTPCEISIAGKTALAVEQKYRALGFRALTPWSPEEEALLIEQFRSGTPPEDIQVGSRSAHAISARLFRLKLLKPRRKVAKWSKRDIQKINILMLRKITAKQLFEENHFPAKSKDAIAQQMRRLRRAAEKKHPAKAKRKG